MTITTIPDIERTLIAARDALCARVEVLETRLEKVLSDRLELKREAESLQAENARLRAVLKQAGRALALEATSPPIDTTGDALRAIRAALEQTP